MADLRPRRRLYLVALLVPVLGGALAYVDTERRLEAELATLTRVQVPGRVALDLSPGDYVVYYERRSLVRGMTYEGGSLDGLTCTMRTPDDEEQTMFSSFEGGSYAAGPYAGAVLFELEAETAGEHILMCSFGASGVGNRIVLAIAPGFMSSIADTMGVVVPAAAVAGLALAAAVWLARRRAPLAEPPPA